jgi:membrane protein involved in colicin uptake
LLNKKKQKSQNNLKLSILFNIKILLISIFIKILILQQQIYYTNKSGGGGGKSYAERTIMKRII